MNQPVAPLNSRNAAASRSSGVSPEIMNQPVARSTSQGRTARGHAPSGAALGGEEWRRAVAVFLGAHAPS